MAVSAALSTGEMLHCPGLTGRERRRLRRLQRTLARARRGSNRRGRVRHAIARLRARETDRRKDWAEKTSTSIARRFDLIRVEDLQIGNMTRSARGTRDDPGRNVRAKAGLNRGILGSGCGLLVRRLEEKAPSRVEKVSPAFTSQRCSACGQVDRDSRQSQAVFRCTACGFACNADVNAAINIAAGHAVTARGGFRDAGRRTANLSCCSSRRSSWNPRLQKGEDVKSMLRLAPLMRLYTGEKPLRARRSGSRPGSRPGFPMALHLSGPSWPGLSRGEQDERQGRRGGNGGWGTATEHQRRPPEAGPSGCSSHLPWPGKLINPGLLLPAG